MTNSSHHNVASGSNSRNLMDLGSLRRDTSRVLENGPDTDPGKIPAVQPPRRRHLSARVTLTGATGRRQFLGERMANTTCLDDRYLLWDILARRVAGARVFLAEDRRRPGQPVVVKCVSIGDPELSPKLHEQLLRVAQFRHPHLNPLLDLGTTHSVTAIDAPRPRWGSNRELARVGPSDLPTNDGLYWVSPYLGTQHLGNQAPLQLQHPEQLDAWLCGVTLQVLEALRALHDAAFVHFDVKPEHVRLHGRYPATLDDSFEMPHVALIDFGLLARESTPLGNRVRGTVPFIAPEVLDRSIIDQRVDLYSLGASLYHALTSNVHLNSHRSGQIIPSPQSAIPDINPFWSSCIERLMTRDPQQRYPHALAVADDIRQHSQQHHPTASIDPQRMPLTIREATTHAQERELDSIVRHLEQLKLAANDKSLVIVQGEHGSGKRDLCRRLEHIAKLRRLICIRVKCETSAHPLRPLLSLFEQLLDNSHTPRALHSRLSDLCKELRAEKAVPLPIPLRSEDRFRLRQRLSEVFEHLDERSCYVFIIEHLHKAAPELLEHLSVIGYRLQRWARQAIRRAPTDTDERAETRAADAPLAGKLLHPAPLPEAPLTEAAISETSPNLAEEYEPTAKHTADSHPPRVLFVATLEPELQMRPTEPIPGRVLTCAQLQRESFASTVDLETKPESDASELLRRILGPSLLSEQQCKGLWDASNGRTRLLGELLRESYLYGLLARRSHGWVWTSDEAPRIALERARASGWSALSTSSQKILLYLHECGGIASRQELEQSLPQLGMADPFPYLEQLRGWNWVQVRPVDESWELLRRTPQLCLIPELRAEFVRAIGRLHRRSHGDFEGTLFGLSHEAPIEELGALDATLQALRSWHCDASLLELTTYAQSLETAPANTTAALALVLLRRAQAWNDLRRPRRALHELQELRRVLGTLAGTPGELEVEGLTLEAQILRHQGQFSAARETLERGLALANDAPLGKVPLLMEMARVLVASGFADKGVQWAQRADDELLSLRRAGTRVAADLEAETKLTLSQALASQQLADQSRRVIENYLQASRDVISLAWQAHLLNHLAQTEYSQGRYDTAEKRWLQALPLCRKIQNLRSVGVITSALGTVAHNRGDTDNASRLHEESLELREALYDIEGVGASKNNIGLIHRLHDRSADAERCFRRCLEIYESLQDSDKQAIALNNLSQLMREKGDYTLALQYSLQGLEKRKALDDQGRVAFSYHNLATIYRTKGELERAFDFAEKSLEIRRELGDKLNLAHSLSELGAIYLLRGQYLESFRCLRQGLANFEAFGDRLGRHDLLNHHARMYQQVGLYTEALEYAERALELAQAQSLDHLIAASLLQRGSIQQSRGASDDAERDLKESEELTRRSNNRRLLAEVLLEQAVVSIEQGKEQHALHYLAEGYNLIEDLGLSDLYPCYYRLRGGIASRHGEQDHLYARRLLERGLEDAQQLELREETWRLELALAQLEFDLGDIGATASWAARAHHSMTTLHSQLPAQFQESYLQTQDCSRLQRLYETTHIEHAETPPAIELVRRPTDTAATPLERDLLRLHEITLSLASERNLSRLLERIMDTVLELFRAERGYLILIQGTQHTIRVARNLDHEEIDGPDYQYSKSIATQVARDKESFITNDAQGDQRLRDAESVHDMRLQAIACFPLVWLGEAIGVIYIENRFRKRLVRTERIPILNAFSNQAAIAIYNARLVEEAERRQEQLAHSRTQIEELNRQLAARVELQGRELEHARQALERQQQVLEGRYQFHNILGACDAMHKLYERMDKVARTELPILIEGESGTGKELAARALHYHGSRRKEAFISENCGALSETLLESELFGHVKGAFTGADHDRPGLFALAEGGTLFLDEVHELSLGMQRKLLRVLQEGEYRPVGGEEFVTANVRIISAANRSLKELVDEGSFRQDLYYRLNVLRVEMPPLRQRGKDIVLLARHFLTEVLKREQIPCRDFTPEALRALSTYEFPGNVRELRNVVEQSAVLAAGPHIDSADLLLEEGGAPAAQAPSPRTGSELDRLDFAEAKLEFQRRYVTRLLARHDGVVARAARSSGITRESLHRLMKKLGVERNGNIG